MTYGASVSSLLAVLVAAPHLLIAVAAGAAFLTVLVFFGIALPAVWSSKPSRRQAAATVFGQILAALRRS
jgi:hypothetical protein